MADAMENWLRFGGEFPWNEREILRYLGHCGQEIPANVKERIWELNATGVVCDDELSPVQLRNLEDALDTKVMDRTMVILDIMSAG